VNINNDPKWVDVECEGNFTPTKYFGKFSVKPYLSNAERADVARLAATFTRGIEDPDQRAFLTTLAFLKFHIVEVDADWWVDGGLSLLDQSPVWTLAAKVRDIQKPVETPANPAPEQKA
jgi:hypothetical protein